MAKTATKAKAAAKKAAATTKKTAPAEAKAYEVMLLMQPDLRESEVKKRLKDFEAELTETGGKVTYNDLWGRQELAYRIKGYSEGIYAVYDIELPSDKLNELNEYLRLEKDVIRHIIVTLPSDYEYTKFEEEDEEELPKAKKSTTKTSKAKKIEPKEAPEPKDKGKEVSGEELDQKLDKIIGGDDIDNL